ncbi:MAG: hypothetical protein ABI763_12700 [Bacteroidota bacterium]
MSLFGCTVIDDPVPTSESPQPPTYQPQYVESVSPEKNGLPSTPPCFVSIILSPRQTSLPTLFVVIESGPIAFELITTEI